MPKGKIEVIIYSQKGGEYMKKAKEPRAFEYNNESYKIYKYSSGVVYVQKETNGTWDFVSAKEIIRRKLAEIDSKLYNYEETGKTKYNTQSLGAKLYKILGLQKKRNNQIVKKHRKT